MTKEELMARVAELDTDKQVLTDRLVMVVNHRDELKAENELNMSTIGELQTKMAQLQDVIASGQASARDDAFLAFIASLPRKTVYKALARAMHPDIGGDTATMQGLNAAYAASKRS